MGLRVSNAAVSYFRYLRKMIWPHDLAAYYPHPGVWPPGQLLGAAVFLAAVTILAVRFARRHPYFFVGWFWFVGTLVPVIGLVQVGAHSMADRYAYVPLIGLFIAMVWGVSEFTQGWRSRTMALSFVSARCWRVV